MSHAIQQLLDRTASTSKRGSPSLRSLPVTLLLAFGLLISAIGCSKQPAKPPATPAPAAHSYTVHGVIEALPAPDRPGSQLIIHHEAIPDFVQRDGRIGMKEMGMPFPLADGLSLDGLAIGDAIEFEFTVDWIGSPGYRVTRISRRDAKPSSPR